MAAGTSGQVRRIGAMVQGRVQGVGFRYFTRDAAHRFNVSGWVKNRGDGGVELEAQGQATEVETFLCEIRTGPPLAHVADVTAHELPPEEKESGFAIRY